MLYRSKFFNISLIVEKAKTPDPNCPMLMGDTVNTYFFSHLK